MYVHHPTCVDCVIPVDEVDADILRSPGLSVGAATAIVCKYAQPGSGLFLTDEYGTPRRSDDPLWGGAGNGRLYYRMTTLDMITAQTAHEKLSAQFMEESDYPNVLGVGYSVKVDPMERRAHYFVLKITLNEKFYGSEALNEAPQGFPSYYRNPERTFCLPIQYQKSSMIYAQ